MFRLGTSILRRLWRHPVSHLVPAVALAFGIGVVTLQFAMVNSLLLRPLPFEDAEELHVLDRRSAATRDRWPFMLWEWPAVRGGIKSFEPLAAITLHGEGQLSIGSGPGRTYSSAMATPNLLELLQVSPVLGSWLSPDDDQTESPLQVVISDRVWEREFGRDPDVLGSTVHLDGESATVVGVMPEAFRFPVNQDLWTAVREHRRVAMTVVPLGRLKAGTTLTEARAELAVAGAQLAENLVQRLEGEWRDLLRRKPDLDPGMFRQFVPEGVEQARVILPRGFLEYYHEGDYLWSRLGSLMGLAFCVLVIACGNVAALMMARMSARARELGVRSALGASRRHLFGLVLGESLLIALMGSVLGLVLSSWGGHLLSALLAEQPGQPFWFDFDLDWRVTTFAGLSALLAGGLSGVVPAIRSARVRASEVSKSVPGSSPLALGRLSEWLVTGQVALALPVLLVAATLVLTAVTVGNTLPGVRPDRLLTGRVFLASAEGVGIDSVGLLRHLNELPGGSAAAISQGLPGLEQGHLAAVETEPLSRDHSLGPTQVIQQIVSPGYFRTLGTGLLRGRDFTDADREGGSPVAIVNTSMVERYWPQDTPLGKRFRVVEGDGAWLTVIGVAPDLGMQGFLKQDLPSAGYYLPLQQHQLAEATVLLRTAGDPLLQVPAVNQALLERGSDSPGRAWGSLAQAQYERTGTIRIFAALFFAFGLGGLLLAAVGLAGLLSFSVTQRTRELGIRLALGSSRRALLWLVMKARLIQLSLGVVLGLLLSWVVGRFAAHFLFTLVAPHDPAVCALLVLCLLATGVAATSLPARRIYRADPLLALRQE